jgi:hypothetical protein
VLLFLYQKYVCAITNGINKFSFLFFKNKTLTDLLDGLELPDPQAGILKASHQELVAKVHRGDQIAVGLATI